MDLVIVESPSKAKTIEKYLGSKYKVLASKGHVVDLPKSEIAIDVENNFKPKYVVTKKESLSALKRAYADSNELILAVDLDREGEAIGWHIAQKLGAVDSKGKSKKGKKVKRIVFHEITKEAITDALNSPRDIDMNLVNAQQARRVLDRLVGYKLSPLLWKKIAFGLSAGRVQSVALRLVVEREQDREAFVPSEYWSISAFLFNNKEKKIEFRTILNDEEKKDYDGIRFNLFKIGGKNPEINNQKESEKILNSLKDKSWIIKSVDKKDVKKNPYPPLITSTLQRSAVNTLGFSAQRTMSIAQKLYEAGHITYMRTDSLSMSEQAISQARKYIKDSYGEKYIPEKPNYYKTKSKNAQEAHECIRPVSFYNTPSGLGLDGEQAKLYQLIWSRAIASQMSSAQIESTSASIEIGKTLFKTTGSRVVFEGYLKVIKEKLDEQMLPSLTPGQELFPKTVISEQHFTKPLSRYTEASLIKKLEELGIGRPSTYAATISTVIARKYVVKENRYLIPTDVGRAVTKLLVKYFPNIVDYSFTASMEDDLDNIADGKKDWVKMIRDFYFPFEKNLKEQEKSLTRDEFKVLGEAPEAVKCPECGSKMVIKLSKYGRFYSCSTFPKCKGMFAIPSESGDEEKNEGSLEDLKEFLDKHEPAPKTDDGREYLLKKGRFGEFWAHPDYPKVKDAKPLVLKEKFLKEKYGEVPKTEDGRDFVLKKGRFGEFWAHPDYPQVKEIISVKSKKTGFTEKWKGKSKRLKRKE